MLIIALAAVPVLLAIAYSFWQLDNSRGWQKAKSPVAVRATAGNPSLALLIPFRNEAENLPALLASIADFRYPNLEVIFIDDHSEDDGAAIVGAVAGAKEEIEKQAPKIRLLSLADHLQGRKVVAYKKAALAYAISQTTAEVIITTDADCRLPVGFPDDIARAFCAGNDVVSGPVLITLQPTFLNRFQATDLLAYQLYTASCVARQKPTLANGACFAFRRQLFLEASGYAGMDHLPSGDDVLLLHKFAQLPDVKFGWHAGVPVYTNAVSSWRALWQQRLRWAGKAGAYVSPRLQFGQALAFLTSLGIVVALLLTPVNGWFFVSAIIAWWIKGNIDQLLLEDISDYYQQKIPFHHYFSTHLVYPFYLVTVGLGALLGMKAEWKGRG